MFFSIAATAFAQPYDKGEYVILRARYGTAARSVDVTDSLRRLARRDRQAQVSNELFGDDPAVRERKTLRVYARDSYGATRLFEYREREIIDGTQFQGWSEGQWGREQHKPYWEDHDPENDRRGRGEQIRSLVIERATYGHGARSIDVTYELRRMVRRNRLVLQVENETFDADPAQGKNKILTVAYVFNGRRQEKQVPEHGRLSLP